jgi:hypothetical protein
MRAYLNNLSALTLGLMTLPAAAVEATMTSAGFTGLGITPNAHLLGWGRFEAAYDNQLPGIVRNPTGHNLVGAFGLLPNLEVSGRLATSDWRSNCFTVPGCGARDLSASGKVAIGLDTRNRFHAAVGVTDVGGSVTYFRSTYGVLTLDEGPLQASAGVAKRTGPGIAGSRSPLHGPFASLAWQPTPLLRGHVEYADGNAWAGVRVFAPQAWLPEGWALSAGANLRLNENRLTERAWVSASLSIPLYKVPSLPGSAAAPSSSPASVPPLPATAPRPTERAATERAEPARSVETSPAFSASQLSSDPVATPPTQPPVLDAKLRALADALQAKGLEDIWVGRMPDSTIAVRANNSAYGWNSLDALGAGLGAIARNLGDEKAGYRFVLTQRQIPLVAVTGQADCLRQWIEQPVAACTAGQLSTPGAMPLEPLHDGATWVVQRQKPAWQTVRVNVSPVLRTTLGTEVGAFDYSLGANVGASVSLWPGASAEWRVNVPVAETENFRSPGVFATRRVRAGTERLAYVHTVRVPLERWLADPAGAKKWGVGGLTAQATVGRVGTYYDGVHGALRWEPGEGVHRLTGEAGVLRNNSFANGAGPLGSLRRAQPILASYRYSLTPTRTYLEATAGQFLNNDRGFQVGFRQWFSDVAVSAFYRRSQYASTPQVQFIGVEVSVPIGPRRDMQLGNVQFGGTPRFSHSIATTVRQGAGNPIRTGYGVLAPVQSIDAATFNSDRSGLVYFEDNLRRIREAAQ